MDNRKRAKNTVIKTPVYEENRFIMDMPTTLKSPVLSSAFPVGRDILKEHGFCAILKKNSDLKQGSSLISDSTPSDDVKDFLKDDTFSFQHPTGISTSVNLNFGNEMLGRLKPMRPLTAKGRIEYNQRIHGLHNHKENDRLAIQLGTVITNTGLVRPQSAVSLSKSNEKLTRPLSASASAVNINLTTGLPNDYKSFFSTLVKKETAEIGSRLPIHHPSNKSALLSNLQSRNEGPSGFKMGDERTHHKEIRSLDPPRIAWPPMIQNDDSIVTYDADLNIPMGLDFVNHVPVIPGTAYVSNKHTQQLQRNNLLNSQKLTKRLNKCMTVIEAPLLPRPSSAQSPAYIKPNTTNINALLDRNPYNILRESHMRSQIAHSRQINMSDEKDNVNFKEFSYNIQIDGKEDKENTFSVNLLDKKKSNLIHASLASLDSPSPSFFDNHASTFMADNPKVNEDDSKNCNNINIITDLSPHEIGPFNNLENDEKNKNLILSSNSPNNGENIQNNIFSLSLPNSPVDTAATTTIKPTNVMKSIGEEDLTVTILPFSQTTSTHHNLHIEDTIQNVLNPSSASANPQDTNSLADHALHTPVLPVDREFQSGDHQKETKTDMVGVIPNDIQFPPDWIDVSNILSSLNYEWRPLFRQLWKDQKKERETISSTSPRNPTPRPKPFESPKQHFIILQEKYQHDGETSCSIPNEIRSEYLKNRPRSANPSFKPSRQVPHADDDEYPVQPNGLANDLCPFPEVYPLPYAPVSVIPQRLAAEVAYTSPSRSKMSQLPPQGICCPPAELNEEHDHGQLPESSRPPGGGHLRTVTISCEPSMRDTTCLPSLVGFYPLPCRFGSTSFIDKYKPKLKFDLDATATPKRRRRPSSAPVFPLAGKQYQPRQRPTLHKIVRSPLKLIDFLYQTSEVERVTRREIALVKSSPRGLSPTSARGLKQESEFHASMQQSSPKHIDMHDRDSHVTFMFNSIGCDEEDSKINCAIHTEENSHLKDQFLNGGRIPMSSIEEVKQDMINCFSSELRDSGGDVQTEQTTGLHYSDGATQDISEIEKDPQVLNEVESEMRNVNFQGTKEDTEDEEERDIGKPTLDIQFQSSLSINPPTLVDPFSIHHLNGIPSSMLLESPRHDIDSQINSARLSFRRTSSTGSLVMHPYPTGLNKFVNRIESAQKKIQNAKTAISQMTLTTMGKKSRDNRLQRKLLATREAYFDQLRKSVQISTDLLFNPVSDASDMKRNSTFVKKTKTLLMEASLKNGHPKDRLQSPPRCIREAIQEVSNVGSLKFFDFRDRNKLSSMKKSINYRQSLKSKNTHVNYSTSASGNDCDVINSNDDTVQPETIVSPNATFWNALDQIDSSQRMAHRPSEGHIEKSSSISIQNHHERPHISPSSSSLAGSKTLQTLPSIPLLQMSSNNALQERNELTKRGIIPSKDINKSMRSVTDIKFHRSASNPIHYPDEKLISDRVAHSNALARTQGDHVKPHVVVRVGPGLRASPTAHMGAFRSWKAPERVFGGPNQTDSYWKKNNKEK